MEKPPSLREFQKRFPDDASCLAHLMRVRYGDRHDCGRCGKNAKFYRVSTRRCFACEFCGYQVYPTADTPFDRTRTPLTDWFFVMWQFCTSRNGVAAKEVERQLGVTYKTAWRMCHQIREYMGVVDGDGPLGGFTRRVEVDETFIGGHKAGGQGGRYKIAVFGMLEHKGRLMTKVVSDRRSGTLLPIIRKNIRQFTEVHSDEWIGYGGLAKMGYWHKTVQHKIEQYVSPTGTTVNSLEGFWAQLKRGINGTHIHVSARHLPKYLGEFEYRYNMRHQPHLMLDRLLNAFAR